MPRSHRSAWECPGGAPRRVGGDSEWEEGANGWRGGWRTACPHLTGAQTETSCTARSRTLRTCQVWRFSSPSLRVGTSGWRSAAGACARFRESTSSRGQVGDRPVDSRNQHRQWVAHSYRSAWEGPGGVPRRVRAPDSGNRPAADDRPGITRSIPGISSRQTANGSRIPLTRFERTVTIQTRPNLRE